MKERSNGAPHFVTKTTHNLQQRKHLHCQVRHSTFDIQLSIYRCSPSSSILSKSKPFIFCDLYSCVVSVKPVAQYWWHTDKSTFLWTQWCNMHASGMFQVTFDPGVDGPSHMTFDPVVERPSLMTFDPRILQWGDSIRWPSYYIF